MKKTRNQKQIVNEIELLLTELKQTLVESQGKPSFRCKAPESSSTSRAQFSGLTGEICALAEEGFFKDPKEISEIQKKLKDEGIVKPTTALMPSLTRLIRKKVLGRNKPQKGPYKYFKR